MIVIDVDDEVEDIKIYWSDIISSTKVSLYDSVLKLENSAEILCNKQPLAVYCKEEKAS